MTDKAVNSVKVWISPLLISVIGFFSINTLNGINKRIDKLEEKIDRLVKYEIILERLSSKQTAFERSPYKHEDFITLKIETDERFPTS